jgi:hypothetical protein
LFDFYPLAKPSEADGFIAGCVAILAHYPPEVIAVVVDPVRGLPSKLKFMPTIADIKEACESEAKEQWEREDRRARWRRAAINGPKVPPQRVTATTSALCERYGLDEIPAGWDAVDVVKAHGRYGDRLNEQIKKGLTTSGLVPKSGNPFAAAAQAAGDRMEDRAALSGELRQQLGLRPAADEAA